MECILCSIERVSLGWSGKLLQKKFFMFLFEWTIDCAILCSKVPVGSWKRGVYETTTKGGWPKTCWQFRGARAVSSRVSWTTPGLQPHNSEVVAQTSHQNCSVLKNNGPFQAAAERQKHPFLPVASVSRISSRSQRNTWILRGLQELTGGFLLPGPAGPCPAEPSSTAGVSSWLQGSSEPGAPVGLPGAALTSTDPPLSVAGTTCRVEVHVVAFGPSLSDSWQRFQPLVPASAWCL